MSFSPELFVENVKNLSSVGHYDSLYQFCSESLKNLSQNLNLLDEILSNFDLNEHTLGILTILSVKIQEVNNESNLENLYSQIEEFINGCNGEQIRIACEIFTGLCHNYTESLISSNQILRGILHLQIAINKVQLNQLQLTSIHSDLCQLCLIAKCLKPVLPYLDIDFNDIAKENKRFDVKYFLQYYYYGGMIYASLKKFERALYFFEIAITTPSAAISMIMLEAYKKYILVSLLLNGNVKTFPKYTSQIVLRHMKQMAPHYNEFSAAYTTYNIQRLNLIVEKYSSTFTVDTNMGLVKQCLISLYKKNIQRLTKTFLTLSLEDMANRIQLSSTSEAEKYILNMIEEGEIFAQINQKDGMVIFLDNPEKYNTPSTLRKLEENMRNCIDIEERIRLMDYENIKNPKFIQKIRSDE